MIAFLLLFLLGASAQSQAQCQQLCADYMMTCANATSPNGIIWDIYNTTQDCINECMEYPNDPACTVGAITDAATCGAGNSWGCRRYHLNVAMSSDPNAVIHCPHATPMSPPTNNTGAANAVNGTVCFTATDFNNTNYVDMVNGLLADFCNQVTNAAACSAYLNGLTMTTCLRVYQFVGGVSDVSMYPGAGGRKFPLAPVTSMTTLPCRRYHAQVARSSSSNAAIHCPHALFGDDQCGSSCENYCNIVMGVCTGANSQYNGTSAMTNCMNACGGFRVSSDYLNNVTSGNTVQCRVYHASVASGSMSAAMVHCPHTGPTGGGVCVDADGGAAAGVSASFVVVAALAVLSKYFM